jgi:DNA-binding beta-propeller fold protein YncE
VKATVEVQHAITGPPQQVAISPDGRIAIVSAPNHYDRTIRKPVLDRFLQVVDFTADPARVIDRIELSAHPQGLAINRSGTLLLAAMIDGSVAVLAIDGNKVTLKEQIKVAEKRLAGISFTHDGTAALVSLRDEGGLLVLDVHDGRVSISANRERITTGLGPYTIDVSADGKWAVVSNAGLASLIDPGRLAGDTDSFTLIDVSRRPFRAVQHVSVPSVPEGIALSPDGRWIAVQTMDGSNLTADNPGRKPRGRVLLFAIRNGGAVQVSDLPSGEAAQGIVFSADGKTVLVQFNVEKQIALFAVEARGLIDTGKRIPMAGGPASIRSMPR